MQKKWRTLGFLALCAMGVVLLLQKEDEPLTYQSSSAGIDDIDATGSRLIQHAYASNGELKYNVYAKSLKHFPEQQRSWFEEPIIITNEKHSEQDSAHEDGWQATALNGVANDDQTLVQLIGRVVLRPSASHPRGAKAIELNTERIDYHVNERQIETDKPVLITTPNSETHAIGMRFDLETQTVMLKHQVRTHYEPQ